MEILKVDTGRYGSYPVSINADCRPVFLGDFPRAGVVVKTVVPDIGSAWGKGAGEYAYRFDNIFVGYVYLS